jgi:hypothetical protein
MGVRDENLFPTHRCPHSSLRFTTNTCSEFHKIAVNVIDVDQVSLLEENRDTFSRLQLSRAQPLENTGYPLKAGHVMTSMA